MTAPNQTQRALNLAFRCVVALALSSVGVSCHIDRYTYDGGQLQTADGMFNAQAEHHARLLQAIAPRAEALVPRCLVVVPDDSVLRKNAVFQQGASQEQIATLAEMVRRDLLFTARVLEKRRICDELGMLEGDGSHVRPKGPGTYFYAFNAEEGSLDWYVVEAGQRRRALPFDGRILDDDQRIEDWLKRVEQRTVPAASGDGAAAAVAPAATQASPPAGAPSP